MHSMLAKILQGYEHQYPRNLEEKFARVFNNLMNLWGSPELDDYFASLFFDERGTRQGFPRDVMDEIFFMSKLHDKFRNVKQSKEEEDIWANEAMKFRMENEFNIEFSPRGYFWAAEKSKDSAIQLFLDAGADVNLRNQFNWTPLMVTTFMGSESSANVLINAGANVSVSDVRGYTPLHWAAQRGFAKVVELLLQKGAYPNVRSKKGISPLQQAAALGQTEVVRLLLSKGASVNAADNEGWTPLHKAVANGHLEIIKLLKDANADPYALHSSGITPVAIAKRSKDEKVIEAVLA